MLNLISGWMAVHWAAHGTARTPRDLWGQLIVDHLQQSNSLVARTASLTTSSPAYREGRKLFCHMSVPPKAMGMWMAVPIHSPGVIFSVLKLTYWHWYALFQQMHFCHDVLASVVTGLGRSFSFGHIWHHYNQHYVLYHTSGLLLYGIPRLTRFKTIYSFNNNNNNNIYNNDSPLLISGHIMKSQ